MNAINRRAKTLVVLGGVFFAWTCSHAADTVLFQDDFQGRLGDGWSWIREHRDAWRVTHGALEVRLEPGNMWGPANDAKNVLVRPAPDPKDGPIEISVTVSNRPSSQYEQVDLVWYYDDSHMVKLGQELVDGQLSIVMGREEKDRTRTIAIIPITAHVVRLRHRVQGARLIGQFLPEGSDAWVTAGQCDLPSSGAAPRIALQFYQGPADLERWARVREFRVTRLRADR